MGFNFDSSPKASRKTVGSACRYVLIVIWIALGACAGARQQSVITGEAKATDLAPDPGAAATSGTAAASGTATAGPKTPTIEPTKTPTIQDASVAAPTVTPTPTETIPAATVTATWTPAPHVNVDQAPYAPSDCSDKYPCNEDISAWEARMRVPSGFKASYYARVEGGPTSITFGPDDLLYVATYAGDILTVDEDGTVSAYVTGLNTPVGLAFRPGTTDLYVSDRALSLNSGGEAQVSVVRDGNVSQVFGDIPCCYTFMHAANGIAFGADGYGYVGVGARADHGEIIDGPRAGEQDKLHPWEATILRFSPDGSLVEPYAFGLRNAYDIAFDADGRLFATDNAPDFGPPDELHRITPGGQHGYPWYECDVCFSAPPDVEVIAPLQELTPHGAAAGITAYLDDRFPGYYNSLFAVLWSAFEGAQKVIRFGPDGVGASDFATGFAAPIDVTVGPDGSLYVADFATGIIWQISYTS